MNSTQSFLPHPAFVACKTPRDRPGAQRSSVVQLTQHAARSRRTKLGRFSLHCGMPKRREEENCGESYGITILKRSTEIEEINRKSYLGEMEGEGEEPCSVRGTPHGEP
jgi:hypothetical protein